MKEQLHAVMMLHGESCEAQAFDLGKKEVLGLPEHWFTATNFTTAESLLSWCYMVLTCCYSAFYFYGHEHFFFPKLRTTCWTPSNTNPESCFSGQYQFGLLL